MGGPGSSALYNLLALAWIASLGGAIVATSAFAWIVTSVFAAGAVLLHRGGKASSAVRDAAVGTVYTHR